jgi:hypothetical protein
MPAAVFEAGWDLESLMPLHREGGKEPAFHS